MEGEDEVVSLFKSILEALTTEGDEEGRRAVWRYFLWQTRAVCWELERRLRRREWRELFRSIKGQRELQLAVVGICPSSCLLGFVVWLCESGHFNCQINCSISSPATDRAFNCVLSALSGSGWKLKRLTAAEHFQELALGDGGLDLVLIAHPMAEDTSWLEPVSHLRQDGAVLVLDTPHASSFTQLERLHGLEYAKPVTVDRLPAGLAVFDEAERLAVQSLAADGRAAVTGLPVLEEARVATMFVNRICRRRRLRSEASLADSWEKSEVGELPPPRQQPRFVAPVVEWQGHWKGHSDVGAVSPEFVFAALEVAPCNAPSANEEQRRRYYETLRDDRAPSQIALEGMGRPMLFKLCRENDL